MARPSSLLVAPRRLGRSALLLSAAALLASCDEARTVGPIAPRDGRPLLAVEASDGFLELALLPGAFEAVGTSVNDEGVVVGVSYSVDEFGAGDVRATLWPADGGPPVELPEFPGSMWSEATGINNRGDVVGRIWSDVGIDAVLWEAGGQPRALPGLGGDVANGALGVSEQYVVGWSKTPLLNRDRATRWSLAGGAGEALHPFTNQTGPTFAYDIDNSGIAVGQFLGGPAIFGGPTTAPRTLSSVGGSWAGETGIAYGISESGDVVGYSYAPLFPGGEFAHRRATLWPAGATRTPRDLESLGDPGAQAFGVSDRGDVVGESGGLFALRATLWLRGRTTARDLGGPVGHATTARSISRSSSYAAGWITMPDGTRRAARFAVGEAPADPDPDADGIATDVDASPTVFSNGFTDVGLGGTTTGTVTGRGDQTLGINDDPAPGGIRIASPSTGGPTPATVEACAGASRFTVTAGDDLRVRCGSVIAFIDVGPVEIRLVAADGRVATTSVGAGNGLTFDPTTFGVTAPPSNTEPIVIVVANNPFTLIPGGSVQLVRDETPPSLALADVRAPATGPDGAVVSYTASATDDFDPSPLVVCAPATGTLFPIGSTTVGCTATDRAGNGSSGTFVVHVLGASEQLAALIELLKGRNLPPSLDVHLVVTLERALEGANGQVACLALDRFVAALGERPGERIPGAESAQLIADATRIQAVLSCE